MMITGITAAFLSRFRCSRDRTFCLICRGIVSLPDGVEKRADSALYYACLLSLGYVEFMAEEHKRAEKFCGIPRRDVVIRERRDVCS